ncbi:MAG: DNA gyrase subunit A [Bacilli bacterium]|jgi:DNA gyrase subunit A|nr:DNA gyrase subunit A [Bacilli bacterium]
MEENNINDNLTSENYDKIVDVNISKEMRESFLAYSMSVIVSRALPDVRDGLKPVHRRIVYAMDKEGFRPNGKTVKSAKIVGVVIGNYHPHGDSSVYEAMVRMAQAWNYRYPLVSSQGNFGSIGGFGAAAQRYTEAKMSNYASLLMSDINEDTVDFMPNFSEDEMEPVVLPSRFPNLLVNGSMGIAVGMATNMAPHNLSEVIDGILAYIHNPDITIAELNEKYITGPDFPTGATILGYSGIRQAYETGKGRVVMRAVCDIEEKAHGKKQIVVTQIPYGLNTSSLLVKIEDLSSNKIISDIDSVEDYSDGNGVRIVIGLKKDVNAEVVLNQLYKMTPLQSSFSINNLALVNGRPELLNLKDLIKYYVQHQIDVIERRTRYRLKKAEERAHILRGFKTAVDNLDRFIEIIRGSHTASEAKMTMQEEFGLDDIQSQAILDMQLRRLTGLAIEELENELNEKELAIADYKDILSHSERVLNIIVEDLTEVKNKYGDKRRTNIISGGFDLEDEDLIPEENVIITMTNIGYVKRLPENTYRLQNRGGRGVKGMATKDGDDVDQMITMSTHDYILAFSNLGKVYRIKAYQIPEASRTAKGLPIVNILKIDSDETIKTILPVKEFSDNRYLFFITKKGIAKRVNLSEFERIQSNGKKAINLREDDELVQVNITNGDEDIFIASNKGKLVRFDETKIRAMGRAAAGVKAMKLPNDAYVIGMTTSSEGKKLLVVSEKGYGKLSDYEDYRKSNRGTQGVITLKITEKNGDLMCLKAVANITQDIILVTSDGIIIRFPIEQVGIKGRATMGVKLVNVNDDAKVSTISVVDALDSGDDNDNTSQEDIELVKN